MTTEILHIYEGMLKQAQADLEKTAIIGRAARGLGDMMGTSGSQMRKGLQELTEEASRSQYADSVLRMADEMGIDPAEAARISSLPDVGRGVTQGAQSAAGQTAGAAADTTATTAGKSGLGPLGVAGLLGLGGAGTAGAYHFGQQKGEERGQKRRNLAFGAGLATGAVAPKLLGQAGQGLQALGGKMESALGPRPRAQAPSPQEQMQAARRHQLQQMMQARGRHGY